MVKEVCGVEDKNLLWVYIIMYIRDLGAKLLGAPLLETLFLGSLWTLSFICNVELTPWLYWSPTSETLDTAKLNISSIWLCIQCNPTQSVLSLCSLLFKKLFFVFFLVFPYYPLSFKTHSNNLISKKVYGPTWMAATTAYVLKLTSHNS